MGRPRKKVVSQEKAAVFKAKYIGPTGGTKRGSNKKSKLIYSSSRITRSTTKKTVDVSGPEQNGEEIVISQQNVSESSRATFTEAKNSPRSGYCKKIVIPTDGSKNIVSLETLDYENIKFEEFYETVMAESSLVDQERNTSAVVHPKAVDLNSQLPPRIENQVTNSCQKYTDIKCEETGDYEEESFTETTTPTEPGISTKNFGCIEFPPNLGVIKFNASLPFHQVESFLRSDLHFFCMYCFGATDSYSSLLHHFRLNHGYKLCAKCHTVGLSYRSLFHVDEVHGLKVNLIAKGKVGMLAKNKCVEPVVEYTTTTEDERVAQTYPALPPNAIPARSVEVKERLTQRKEPQVEKTPSAVNKSHAGEVIVREEFETDFAYGSAISTGLLYECRVCLKPFASLVVYKQHFEEDHKSCFKYEMFEENWMCPFCEDNFPSSAETEKHYALEHRRHFRIWKMHPAFAQLVKNPRDFRKRYCCRFCSERFLFNKAFQTHMKEQHKDEQDANKRKQKRKMYKDVEQLMLQCKYCAETFPQDDVLEMHVKFDHSKEENTSKKIADKKSVEFEVVQYKCHRCTMKFRDPVALQCHLDIEHSQNNSSDAPNVAAYISFVD